MSLIVENNAIHMPLLALRGVVVFPNTVASFDVGRKKSINALKYAMEKNQLIFLVTQKDFYLDDPDGNDLYKVGCVAKIKQILRVSDNLTKVLVQGLYRATHTDFYDTSKFYTARVLKCEEKPINNREIYKETLIRRVRNEFHKYMSLMPKTSPDIEMTVENTDDLGYLADFIAFNISAPFDDKQYILEQMSPVTRAKILIELLAKECEINLIDRRIAEKTRTNIDDHQKEYYLREQLKVISNELYGDDSADEIDTYHTKIELLSAKADVKEKLHIHVNKLSKMPQGSHEGTVERNYLDTCIELPWDAYTTTSSDVLKAEKILNRDIYGLSKVKERILELLSVYALSPNISGQIICLVGPPGVGKTSIGRTIAECMGRKFARVSLGGIHDESEIRGHRKTYIGAMPGKIITALKQSGSGNPVILLDEIDKLGKDFKGDPASALLEVLDPEQNTTFVDHYVEIPYDLSKVVFITTANSLDTIPAPLLDRMEVIEVSSYTREEKFQIAKRHLISKQIARHGLSKTQVKLADSAIYSIIDFYTREAGVRKLERTIASLCRKSAKLIASGEKKRVIINENQLLTMLGAKKYTPEMILPESMVGIINGLAWTAVGGEIMQLEVSVMDGTGKVELTGSLGDVMKESAKAAVSFVRSNALQYGIDCEFYKSKDIHIHATEAAIPKDGPSAGVTMVTALVSALTDKKIKRDIAMTGEVTLRGRVLKIGGLREKAMAAYRGGVKTVFIPKDNLADLDEVDAVVKENVRFVPVSMVQEILESAFVEETMESENNCIFESFATSHHNTVSQ